LATTPAKADPSLSRLPVTSVNAKVKAAMARAVGVSVSMDRR